MTMAQQKPKTDLYGEDDGITIGLTQYGDICKPSDDDCALRVIGHAMYACSAEQAEHKIRAEYVLHNPLAAISKAWRTYAMRAA